VAAKGDEGSNCRTREGRGAKYTAVAIHEDQKRRGFQQREIRTKFSLEGLGGRNENLCETPQAEDFEEDWGGDEARTRKNSVGRKKGGAILTVKWRRQTCWANEFTEGTIGSGRREGATKKEKDDMRNQPIIQRRATLKGRGGGGVCVLRCTGQ